MATYVVGDVQGCYDTLCRLLEKIEFDEDHDKLWLAGDLVNRGPRSVEVLRHIRDLGKAAIVVLGNHDMHLLGHWHGARDRKPLDTLKQVVKAHDAEQLVDWLRKRPLVHRKKGYLMVHAGLHPTWSLDVAVSLAREVESHLRGDDWNLFIDELYAKPPRPWSPEHTGKRRLRSILSVLVTIRCVRKDGSLSGFSGPPERCPSGSRPWYELRPAGETDTLLFGHWAMLGHRIGKNWISLDSGCVWGGRLTAVRLDDRKVFQVDSVD